MKLILTLIFLSITIGGISQGLCDRTRISRSLKKYHKIRDCNKANKRLSKVKWQKDSTNNQEQYFKMLYLEKMCESRGQIYDTIDCVNRDTNSLKNDIIDVGLLISNLSLFNKKKKKYRTKYGIDMVYLTNLENYLKLCLKWHIDESNGKKNDGEKNHGEKEKEEEEEEERKKKIEEKVQDEVNKITGNTADMLNKMENHSSFKELSRITENRFEMKIAIAIDDSIVKYTIDIGYDEKAFGVGAYFDENIYNLLDQTFLNIQNILYGKNLICTAFGSADAGFVGSGISYPKPSKNWGIVKYPPVTRTMVGRESITDEAFINIMGPKIDDYELAFLRAFNAILIITENTGENPQYTHITDYQESSGKVGEKFRTTGFIVIAYHDFFNNLTIEQKERITKGGFQFNQIIRSENGKFVVQ